MNITSKHLLIALIAFFIVLISVIIYRLFFQFNSKDISIYIDEEAKKYDGMDRVNVFALIQDGVEHILCSHNQVQQVLRVASANKVPKEQVLVHAAIMQAMQNGYIGDAPTATV
jgi:hypothetical protein